MKKNCLFYVRFQKVLFSIFIKEPFLSYEFPLYLMGEWLKS